MGTKIRSVGSLGSIGLYSRAVATGGDEGLDIIDYSGTDAGNAAASDAQAAADATNKVDAAGTGAANTGLQTQVTLGPHPAFIKFGKAMSLDNSGDDLALRVFRKLPKPEAPPPDITLAFERKIPVGDWPAGFGPLSGLARLSAAQETNMPNYADVSAADQANSTSANAAAVLPMQADIAAAQASSFVADANAQTAKAQAAANAAQKLASTAQSALAKGDRATAGAAAVRYLLSARNAVQARARALKSKAQAVSYADVARHTAQADALVNKSATFIEAGRPDSAAGVDQQIQILRDSAENAQRAAQMISAQTAVQMPFSLSDEKLAEVGARFNLRVQRRDGERSDYATLSVLQGLGNGELAHVDNRLAALGYYGGGSIGGMLAAAEYGDLAGFKSGLGSFMTDIRSVVDGVADQIGINPASVDAAFDALDSGGGGTSTTPTPGAPKPTPKAAPPASSSKMPYYIIGGVALAGIAAFFVLRK